MNSYDTHLMCPLISTKGHRVINSVNDTVEIRYQVSRLWIVQQGFDGISFPHATCDIFAELFHLFCNQCGTVFVLCPMEFFDL